MTKYNFWFFSSLAIALIVAMPIITVFFSFFAETSNYLTVLKNTFLFDYINNSLTIVSVVFLTSSGVPFNISKSSCVNSGCLSFLESSSR